MATLGLGLAASPALIAQDRHRRRARNEMFSHDEPVRTPMDKPAPFSWDDSTLTAAWIGHATVLINLFGFRIITDPVFTERIGLNILNMFTLGPRRLVLPAISPEELPPIDLILLSHAHMDHLDTRSLNSFDRKIPIVIAKNTLDVIEDMGFQEIYELDWNEWAGINDLRIEALEVKHFGWRYPWEKDRSRGFKEGRSYNAYLLTRNGHSIVFGGDTAYQDKFKQLKERNLKIDLAIMPIGAYDPWIHAHANPEEALAMADHMGAHHILPIHWNTFIQSEEPTVEPIERLKRAVAAQPGRIVIDDIGKTWALNSGSHQFPASGG